MMADTVGTELLLPRLCRKNGLVLDQEQQERLVRYAQLLEEWNGRINLISRRDTGNIRLTHLLHSLAPLFLLRIPRGVRMLDLGSGGGLPGIPLAIARPDFEVTLLDSIGKKTVALEDMVGRLGLRNVQVRTGRAGQLDPRRFFDGLFDIVIARAVAPLSDLLRWSRDLVRKSSGGGVEFTLRPAAGAEEWRARFPVLLALKGGDLEKEIRQVRTKLHEENIRIFDLCFEGSDQLGLVDKKLLLLSYDSSISVIA